MSKTTDLMKQQMAEMMAQHNDILSKSEPLRKERDTIKNDAMAKVRVLNAQIKIIEKDLPELDMDLGRLARGLGGRFLSRPAQ